MRIWKKILTGILVGAMTIGMTGVVPVEEESMTIAEAAGAVNILDYESNETASEFAVYDVEGMEYLAELVNEKKITFDGKTITLENDLEYDKTKENNHTPIGKNHRRFGGIFDGKNHVIKGININTTDRWAVGGIFSTVGSSSSAGGNVIKNVILDDSNVIGHSTYVGGIIGSAGSFRSKIENCKTTKAVKVYKGNSSSSCIGGIIGMTLSQTEIIRCCNAADIICRECNSPTECIGGIAGDESSIIKECVNYGDIWTSGTGAIVVGGIIPYCLNDDGYYVISCCNYGKISHSNLNETTGVGADLSGICAGYWDKINYDIVNCYNAGMISVGSGNECGYGIGYGLNVYSVGTVSAASNGQAAALCIPYDTRTLGKGYWLSGTAPAGIEMWKDLSPEDRAQIDTSSIYECTKSKMKSQAFVDELNANSVAAGYGEVWERDTEGFNHGYPILKNVPYDKSFYWDDAEGGEEEEEPSETGITNLFQNDKYTYPVKADSITIYANGATVTKDGKKTNFKSKAIYTDILASYKYWTDTKGKYQTSTGKVIVGITKTNEKSKLSFNKKGSIVDAAAAKIASASIKDGRITVTAKSEAGKVYLWVLDTGDAGKYTCCPVTVKMAPTTLETYAISDTDASFKYGTTKKYTKENIDITDSVDVYVYPYYKESGVAKKTADATYSAEVESKIDGCFTVTKSGTNKFTIRATGLKTGTAKTTGNVIIKCDQNGKKVNFNVTALNHVRKAELGNADKVTLNATTNEITIEPSNSTKMTGTVKVQMTKSLSTKDTTDAPKIYAMAAADGYDAAKLAAGAVSITKAPSKAQKKLAAAIGTDKKTITVSADKGTPKGQTTYFLLVYNTSSTSVKKGYMVFSVKTV